VRIRQSTNGHEEGVIAKRAAGLYYSGKRTREWVKFKAVHEQEVVIVGYTEPRRSRKYFGSLVLAVRDKAGKRWVYAAHVGTGFDQAALKSLYGTMQPLRSDKNPFDQKVKSENATTWLIPKLVGEVKFTEWTSESEMRHPAFLGFAPTNGRSTPSANKLERNFDETSARWQFVAFTHTLSRRATDMANPSFLTRSRQGSPTVSWPYSMD
jgi:ATP-dependent DNA ligase